MAYEEVTIVVGPYVQIRFGKKVAVSGYTYTRVVWKPDDSSKPAGAGSNSGADVGTPPQDDKSQAEMRAKLQSAADEGYDSDPGNCVGSVRTAAKAMGIGELERQGNANNTISYVEKRWRGPLSAEEAQALANAGKFAVAAQASQPGQTSGHVMVVVPGELKKLSDGKKYPMVKGGGSEEGRSPAPIEKGGQLKSAGECWKRKHRDGIRYWTPR